MSFIPNCAKCPTTHCVPNSRKELDANVLPKNCPIKVVPEVIERCVKRYGEKAVERVYVPATITEKEAYQLIRGAVMAVRPRVKELIEFAKLMRFRKIGVAFCIGLKNEASRLTEILERQGFTVASALCKCGAADKTELGIDKEYKIENPDEFESACKPLLQAELLNRAETELNVIVGLCIGHDTLFTKESKAPVTTLIVKDRVLGHNPVAALYSTYHKDIIESQKRA